MPKNEVKFSTGQLCIHKQLATAELMLIDVAEGKTILSEKNQQIDPVLKCALLVAVVPNHGATEYIWERENSSLHWVNLNVPTGACILYTRSCGRYRCQVSGQVHHFEVRDAESHKGINGQLMGISYYDYYDYYYSKFHSYLLFPVKLMSGRITF